MRHTMACLYNNAKYKFIKIMWYFYSELIREKVVFVLNSFSPPLINLLLSNYHGFYSPK